MGELTIVPAGAGSGKTYRIQTTLTEWVKAGIVRPDRILAVTYTEAAASELRGRIRASLVAAGLVEEAIALERAYVSTIHALGSRILTEHALAAGASPAPRLIDEAEEQALIRQLIAGADAFEAISADPHRFGHRGDSFGDFKSGEEKMVGLILKVVNLMRQMGPRATEPSLADIAEAEIRKLHGPTGDAATLGGALHRAVNALLSAHPDGIASDTLSQTARKNFGDDLRKLRQARKREAIDGNWALWQSLRKLNISPKKALPDGYEALANAVTTAADGLCRHPGPLDDACRHARTLIEGAQSILARYGEAKMQLQAIDYSDMIASAERIVAGNGEVSAALSGSIDCVIIDEFQDTNPIQFALLWQLAQIAPRTLIVGDLKQAIMGFQGADPRLMQALIEGRAGKLEPLENNYRSDPRIMAFVNALGPSLFGPGYQPLAPKRDAGKTPALEILTLEKAGSAKNMNSGEFHLAARLKAMLGEPEPWVPTEQKGVSRRLRPSDIAILCLTNKQAAAHAAALRRLGLPVRISADGWLDSRIIRVALNALLLAADPEDRHALLCFAVFGPLGLPLDTALAQLMDGTLSARSDMVGHLSLGLEADRLGMAGLLDRVLAATGLRDWLERLDDPLQARANLIRLEDEAVAFDQLDDALLSVQGFFGRRPKVFCGWLSARNGDDADRQPNPAALAADGIELVTWHKAKGREWPVVAVTGLADDHMPRALQMRTVYNDFSRIGATLDSAELRFTPFFDAPETQALHLKALVPEATETARRLIYVALTRARDRLVIVWPEHAIEKATEKRLNIGLLAHDCAMSVEAGTVKVGTERFPARLTRCGSDAPPEFAEPDRPDAAGRLAFGRQAIEPRPMRDPGRPLIIRPSDKAVTVASPAGPIIHTRIGEGFPLSAGGTAVEKGSLLHEAVRFLMIDPALKPRVARYTGLEPDLLARLETETAALAAELASRGYRQFHHEIPFSVLMPDGGTTMAIIDLLAESEDGLAVIDHKSDATDRLDERFGLYLPQLHAYGEMLSIARPDKKVKWLAINWIGKGTLSGLDLA